MINKIIIFITLILSGTGIANGGAEYLNEIQDEFLSGNFESVIEISGEWIDAGETDSGIPYFYKAYGMYSLNYLDDAAAVLERGLRTEGGIEEFLAVSKNLAADNPDNPYALMALGDAYNRAGEKEKAVDILNEAIGMDPGFGEAYFILGFVYLTQYGEKEKAYQTFEEGVEADPDFIGNHMYLGPHYIRKDNLERAEEIFTAALGRLTDKRQTAYFHNRLADIYIINERYDDAIELLQEGLENIGDNFGLLLSLGDAYFKKGREEEAVDVYLRAQDALYETERGRRPAPGAREALKTRLRQLGVIE